jgi:hypothetical protein
VQPVRHATHAHSHLIRRHRVQRVAQIPAITLIIGKTADRRQLPGTISATGWKIFSQINLFA